MKQKFYICNVCGNIITKLHDSGVTPYCCGKEMSELKENTDELVGEKHLPIYHEYNDEYIIVRVGEKTHPMEKNHYIMFIAIETNKGLSIKYLNPSDEPETDFSLASDEVLKKIYCYCNVHGLWKSNVNNY